MWLFKKKGATLNPLFEKEMTILRPLPIGKKQFDEWSARIIAAAQVPGATIESQKFALAAMLQQLDSTEFAKDDFYFVKCLKKGAVNQTAQAIMKEIKEAHEKKKTESGAVTPDAKAPDEVLRDGNVQGT